MQVLQVLSNMSFHGLTVESILYIIIALFYLVILFVELVDDSEMMVDVKNKPEAVGRNIGQEYRSYTMKKGIHPDYQLTKITCVCGNVIETRSTVKDIHVEICSACHPFYTGKQKLVDTAGRIDRFNKRYGIKDNK